MDNNTIPKNVRAGDSLEWEQSFDSFNTNSYNLSYILINSVGKITITATKDLVNNEFKVLVVPLNTLSYAVGNYKIYAIVESLDLAFKQTIDFGYIEVLESIFNSINKDVVSHNSKVLNSIKAVIENRATIDQMSYSIQGRSLSRMPVKDLIYFKQYYEGLVNSEVLAEKAKTGGTVTKKNRIFIKFN